MREHPEACRATEQRAIIEDFAGGPWLDAGLTTRSLPPIDNVLRDLDIPVFIMNGENELPDFVHVANELEALLPDCRRGVIERAGGFPLWEFPESVNAAVGSFLVGAARA
jgi:pimeloyl-ACP methyl ester carboxylesterase